MVWSVRTFCGMLTHITEMDNHEVVLRAHSVLAEPWIGGIGSFETPMNDLFRTPRCYQTTPERRSHFPPKATIKVRRETTDKILLPTRTKNRIPVARLAEFEIDKAL